MKLLQKTTKCKIRQRGCEIITKNYKVQNNKETGDSTYVYGKTFNKA